jgi:hypothetical protein
MIRKKKQNLEYQNYHVQKIIIPLKLRQGFCTKDQG